ncbi:MAG: pyridoxal phosphate-dependent aminotransferase, partial [Candidatus Odinarchaeia archaeon]
PFKISQIPKSPESIYYEVKKFEKEQRVKVTRFDVAEPYFEPPEGIIEKTCQAIKEGYRRYSPIKGLTELRNALSSFLYETRGVKYDEEEIIVTPGGKFASYSFFASNIKPDDEIILLTPFWSSFKAIPMILGLYKIKEVLTDPLYNINHERFQNALTEKTKLVVVNTPNNPTGGVIKKEDLKFLADLAMEKDFYILSDEVDWAYVYDEHKHYTPASLGAWEKTLLVDSFSKVFCMTGWRVGFAAGPREIIDKMNVVQQHSVTAPVTFAQKACLDVLEDSKEFIKELLKQAVRKRDFLVNGLKDIYYLEFSKPEGAFYLFPNAKHYGVDSIKLATLLLRKAHVAVAPGALFGKGSEFNFRICYAIPDSELETGVRRLREFFSNSPISS